MKRAKAIALLAALAGCHGPVFLGGEYRARHGDPPPGTVVSERMDLVKDDQWTFFWGLVDTGWRNIDEALADQLRGDEYFVDLDVREDTTPDGAALGYMTAGIVSHREVVVRGRLVSPRAGPERSAASPRQP